MAQPYQFGDARVRTNKYTPYVYKSIASLIPVKRPGLGTMAVDDKMRVYFDPALFTEWPIDKSTFVILHEGMHVILRHAKRCRTLLGENPTQEQLKVWNFAADATVNHTLRDAGLPVPNECVTYRSLGLPENLSTEECYKRLTEQAQEADEDAPGSPQSDESGTEGDGDSEGSGESEGSSEPSDDTDGATGGGMAPGEPYDGERPAPGEGSGGSCADGQPRPWECPAESEGGPAEMSDYDQDMIERAVAEDIERYARENRGTMPGSLAKLAADILRPKVDPFKQIAAAVKYAVTVVPGCGDYTWRKLPRRSPPGACRLPASIKPVPRATVIVDTSLSMGSEDHGLALGAIQLGLRSVPSNRLRIMVGGTRPEKVKDVFRVEDVELLAGGGTDMGALIEAAAIERPTPDAIVVLSDGETGWGSPVVPRVVAVLTRKPGWGSLPPPWITTIKLYEA